MEFIFERATEQELDEIDALMQEVYSGMENKELFCADDKAFLQRHIEKEGFILLAKDNAPTLSGSSLAAFLVIRYPGEAEDNLGTCLSLPPEELKKVAHMESAVVKSKYRGNHLQEQLLMQAEFLLSTSTYEYLMCTVAPDNLYSMRNVRRLGYLEITTIPKYGNRLRTILCKYI